MVMMLLAMSVSAQKPDFRFSLNGGYLMPNNSRYSDFNAFTYGVDAAILWRFEGDSYWQHFWHWPWFGFKASYARIPDNIAGDRLGLVGYMIGPLGQHFAWHFGLGFSGYTKPYQWTGDTNNIFIGSFLNCLIDLGFSYHLTKTTDVAFHVMHTSNGMLMRPNLGLNYFQLDLSYMLPNSQQSMGNGELLKPSDFREREFGVALSGGAVMSREPEFTGHYPCYNLMLYYQHYTSPVFAFGGALDIWGNFADREIVKQEEMHYSIPLQVSAMGLIETFWGALSMKVGLGVTIATTQLVTNPIYERWGGYYNFSNCFTGVAVNAHAGRVEFIEWTFGYRIPVD
jgi:hypothetical protein